MFRVFTFTVARFSDGPRASDLGPSENQATFTGASDLLSRLSGILTLKQMRHPATVVSRRFICVD